MRYLMLVVTALALFWIGCGGSDWKGDAQGGDDVTGSGEIIQLPCPDGAYQCPDGVCISMADLCNGVPQCGGNADEDPGMCGQQGCAAGSPTWQCPGGKCILTTGLCDGFPDCPGGEDEKQEQCPTCDEGLWLCPGSTQCIELEWQCDGWEDCPDAADEAAELCQAEVGPRVRCNRDWLLR